MTRLLMFLSFWPASYVIMKEHDSETLGWYLSAYAAAYGAGKFADKMGNGNAEKTVVAYHESIPPMAGNSSSDAPSDVGSISSMACKVSAGRKKPAKSRKRRPY